MTRRTARIAIPAGLGAFLLASLLACCDRPEAPHCLRAAGRDTVVQAWATEPVERLVVRDGVEVVLRAEGDSGVTAWTWTGPANVVAWAETAVDAGELRVGDGNRCRWVRDLGVRLRLEVSAPGVRAVEHRGTGDFTWHIGEADGAWSFDGKGFAGRAEVIGRTDSLRLHLHNGPGFVAASGSTGRLGAYVSGLGTLDAGELAAERAFVNQSSAHDLVFRATDYAYIGLHGYGDVIARERPADYQVERTERGQVIWPD
jgi:hypothetical protein